MAASQKYSSFRVRRTFVEPVLVEDGEDHMSLTRSSSDPTTLGSRKPQALQIQLPSPRALKRDLHQRLAYAAVHELAPVSTAAQQQAAIRNAIDEHSHHTTVEQTDELTKLHPRAQESLCDHLDFRERAVDQCGRECALANAVANYVKEKQSKHRSRGGRGCGYSAAKQNLILAESIDVSYSLTAALAEASAPADGSFACFAEPNELMRNGPWFGDSHWFHSECDKMGRLSGDMRQFTKTGFEGRLSLLSETHIKTCGQLKYLVRFTNGELSKADGVGFVFTNKLPCTKNIQKITSIFVNQRGRICVRVNSEVKQLSVYLKPLVLGDFIGLAVDMESRRALFVLWPGNGGPLSYASVAFGAILSSSQCEGVVTRNMPGHFACVVKHTGVKAAIMS